MIIRIPTVIPRIPNIPTPIPRVPTLISGVPTLILHVTIIPLIPFPDSPFRLLQIDKAFNSIWKKKHIDIQSFVDFNVMDKKWQYNHFWSYECFIYVKIWFSFLSLFQKLSDGNGTQIRNHVVCKQTLNHLVKLASLAK